MQSGELLDGRYEVEHLAGVGGMGEVFRGLDRVTGQPVAIKRIHRTKSIDRQRFEREASCLSALHHPAIVRYVGHVVDEQGAYLVMEWLEGESLAARLERSRLTLAESVALGTRVAEALAVAHAAGVVHRDLKPSNLVLVDGVLDKAKLIDFGLARTGDPTLTGPDATLGTPGYMAPEQARQAHEADARADAYSLGAVLFRCLTGRLPFVARDPLGLLLQAASEDAPRVSSVVAGVPDELDDLVARLLARDPAERPTGIVEELAHVDAELRVSRRGWSVPVSRPVPQPSGAAAATVATQRAESPAAEAARAWRVSPSPPQADVHSRESTAAAESPRAAGARASRPTPSRLTDARAVDAPAPGSARARPRMHPATAALITIGMVVLLCGACGSGCFYCTCMQPRSSHPTSAAAPAPPPVKDAGRAPSPSRTAPSRAPH